MTDSRLKSVSEVIVNLAVGYPLAHLTNLVILVPAAPHIQEGAMHGLFSLELNTAILLIGVFYTVISVVRQYLFRRLFERFGEHESFYTLLIRLVNYLKRV